MPSDGRHLGAVFSSRPRKTRMDHDDEVHDLHAKIGQLTGTGFFGQRAQAMSRGERKAMIARDHPGLSLSRQCQVLAISRSSFYYAPKGESADNLAHDAAHR